MKSQELQNALKIEDGQVLIAPDSMDETFRYQILAPFYKAGIKITRAKYDTLSEHKVVISGEASFPLLNLAGTTPILATFDLVGNGVKETLRATIRYELLPNWGFLHSFPYLPIAVSYKNQQYDYASGKSALDTTFSLTERYFYLTTHEHDLGAAAIFGDDSLTEKITLRKGLNFVGRLADVGMVGLLAKLASGEGGNRALLHGPVILSSTLPLPTLKGNQPPWDAQESSRRGAGPAVPGIHLEIPLGSGLSLPVGSDTSIKFTNLRRVTYSPLSEYWPRQNPSYEPAMAYLGDVQIGNTKLLTLSAMLLSGRDDELVFACRFDERINLENLLNAFKTGKDSILPDPLRKAIGTLGPKSASITLVRSAPGYEVACTQLTIGMDESATWSPFGNLIELKFDSMRVAVVKPFDSEQRAVFATLEGQTTLFGVALNVRVEAPIVYISAEQKGIAKVSFKDWCEKLGMPPGTRYPPDFDVANIALVAEPGFYYAFSMDTQGREWEIDNKYSLPKVRLAVSRTTDKSTTYWVWQFEASTDGPKGVPVGSLIQQLAAKLDITIRLPAAIEGLTVDSVAVSYNSKSRDFAFECWGSLPLDAVTLNCGFTIEHAPAIEERPSKTDFGGQVLVTPTGQEPLSFSLKFRKEGDSKYCVAAYNDPFGRELNIKNLARSVFSPPKPSPMADSELETLRAEEEEPSLVDLIPDSLTMTLNSALLAYYSKDPAKKSAADSTGSTTGSAAGSGTKPEAESVVLFGVDLGAKVELSDLPLVGKAMPKGQAIGFESLRIIVASAALEQESVASLDEILLDKGIKPLSDVSGKGDGKGGLQKFNISAELLFGSLSRTLSLPVEGGKKESTQERTPSEATAVAPSTKVEGAGSPAETTTDATKWFEIDKSMGPVSVRRIGLGYDNGRVGIKFDASLQLSVLTFNLEGLGLTYPVDKFTEPSQFLKHVEFTLDGMGLALGNGPIEIGGSLVRSLARTCGLGTRGHAADSNRAVHLLGIRLVCRR